MLQHPHALAEQRRPSAHPKQPDRSQPYDRAPKGAQVEAPAYVTLTAGAERLSLCTRTLRRAIAAGELQGFKFGKALRVRLDDLDRWAESKAMPSARTVRKVR